MPQTITHETIVLAREKVAAALRLLSSAQDSLGYATTTPRTAVAVDGIWAKLGNARAEVKLIELKLIELNETLARETGVPAPAPRVSKNPRGAAKKPYQKV